jgi:hypothetical protein
VVAGACLLESVGVVAAGGSVSPPQAVNKRIIMAVDAVNEDERMTSSKTL